MSYRSKASVTSEKKTVLQVFEILWNEKWDDLAVFHINAVIFPPHRPF